MVLTRGQFKQAIDELDIILNEMKKLPFIYTLMIESDLQNWREKHWDSLYDYWLPFAGKFDYLKDAVYEQMIMVISKLGWGRWGNKNNLCARKVLVDSYHPYLQFLSDLLNKK